MPFPEICYEKIGCGAGGRDFPDFPNILRVFWGKEEDFKPDKDVYQIEANIDDSTPEWLGAVIPRLLDAGAFDAWLTPIVMKKGRPAHCLSVLCPGSLQQPMERLIFTETTTFGIRRRAVDRTTLERHIETVQTEYGPIPVKVGQLDGTEITRAPEHDACADAAAKHNVSVRSVWAESIRTRD